MATARMEVKVDEKLKEKAKRASALLGMRGYTEYIASLIDENATKVIAQHENMTIKNDIFDRFMSACIEARKPNKTLLDAATFTKNQGIK